MPVRKVWALQGSKSHIHPELQFPGVSKASAPLVTQEPGQGAPASGATGSATRLPGASAREGGDGGPRVSTSLLLRSPFRAHGWGGACREQVGHLLWDRDLSSLFPRVLHAQHLAWLVAGAPDTCGVNAGVSARRLQSPGSTGRSGWLLTTPIAKPSSLGSTVHPSAPRGFTEGSSQRGEGSSSFRHLTLCFPW